MECIFEILLPILGEFFVGAGFEFLAEAIGRLFAWFFRLVAGAAADDTINARRVGRAFLWALGGVACGLLSVWILPQPMIRVPILHVVNLVVTPLLMAAALARWHHWMSRRSSRPPQKGHFFNAYAFALCYLLVRFFLARGSA